MKGSFYDSYLFSVSVAAENENPMGVGEGDKPKNVLIVILISLTATTRVIQYFYQGSILWEVWPPIYFVGGIPPFCRP